ncbi:hypothetical protein BDV33DRAFT_201398 [Aspergillus novoparasiticus]|uniref:DUF6604 domain-containing protein n=1 Tax=Aspergillus novoparasiticus TaxID=986946 RepID=A0A5N6F0S8_9EURO|nr:hypothetical protein BDV33DRAFT_201398 [Aspergillus novoparasiticus]
MLSELLTSSYLQCKEDTNAVASWLACTAKRCGYAMDQLKQTAKEEPSGRLKGKARKQAKSKKSSATTIDTIAIKDFVSLAEWIARDHRSPIHVPSSFVTALERAIRTRRRHGDYLAHKSKSAEEGHAYFIGIIERIHETFRPRFPREFLGTGDDDSKKTKINRFKGLEVQEPSKEFLQLRNLPTAVRMSSVGSEANYQAEQCRIWTKHSPHSYDVVAASLMTNTALDLARRLENDAKPLFDQFGEPKEMLTVTYLALCSEKGEDPAFREHHGDDMNLCMWEVSSGIFWPVYQALQSFVLMDPTSDRTKKTAREKLAEDKTILTENLGEFALLCMRVPKMVYLDIHHVLREYITCGYADLETTARQVSNSTELNFERHKSLRVATWPRSNDLVFKDIQQAINYWVRYDPLIEAKAKLNRPLSEPFKFWRSHPLLCGLITYHFKIRFQEASVAFVSAWGSLLYTYHLYNAARQEKLHQGEWLDIDLIMALQDGVLVGDLPWTPEDHLKRFTLSMGYSASAYAKNKRRISPQASTHGPRGLQELAPVAQMFRARYCDGSGQTEWTRVDIEKVVSKSEWTDYENGLSESTQGLSLSSNGRKQQASIYSTGDTHRQLNTVELLEHLRNALQEETLELSFPYLALHRMCWLLLRRIDERCRQHLQRMFGFEYIEHENQLPFVVGYILMAATETRQVGNLLKPRNSDQATSRSLDEAAFVMEGYIEYGGNFSCRLLETHNIVVGEDDED